MTQPSIAIGGSRKHPRAIERKNMKQQAILVSLVALCTATACAVSIPQSPVVTYGLVRDEFGSPLTAASAAEMTLVKDADTNGTIYARTVVGPTVYPSVNYRLSLEIDSEGPVRPHAVVQGTPMRVTCTIDGEAQTLSPSPVFATPVNGTAQRLDFAIGEDADGDGLPDAWESWMLRLDGRPYDAVAVAAFNPADDSDGDGMTNLQEFLAGTDPFLSTDLLEITSFRKVNESGRMEIKFTTVPERTYRLVMTEKLGAEALWTPCATTKNADGATSYETYAGTGRILTIYVDVPGEAKSTFFRIAGN